MSSTDIEYPEFTLSALNHKYHAIFEKYGIIKLCWLISEKNGNKKEFEDKFKCYYMMIVSFLKAADAKLRNKTDDVHYRDLEIMKEHVFLLKNYLDLKHGELAKQTGGKRKPSKKAAKKGSKKGSRKGSKKRGKK